MSIRPVLEDDQQYIILAQNANLDQGQSKSGSLIYHRWRMSEDFFQDKPLHTNLINCKKNS